MLCSSSTKIYWYWLYFQSINLNGIKLRCNISHFLIKQAFNRKRGYKNCQWKANNVGYLLWMVEKELFSWQGEKTKHSEIKRQLKWKLIF